MRRPLGPTLALLLATALLAGCGDDPGDTGERAVDPSTATTATTGTGEPTEADPPPQTDGPHLLGIVHQSGAGGDVDLTATPVGTPDGLADFVSQFRTPGLEDLIRTEAARASGEPYAAVISIGCDVPPGAEVSTDADGNYVVTPFKVKQPTPECLVAVTSVAVLG